jgi:hypothetical protein
MKNEMQEFLDNLDKLTFVSIDGNTLHTSEGFEISYNLKMMSNISKLPNTTTAENMFRWCLYNVLGVYIKRRQLDCYNVVGEEVK